MLCNSVVLHLLDSSSRVGGFEGLNCGVGSCSCWSLVVYVLCELVRLRLRGGSWCTVVGVTDLCSGSYWIFSLSY